MYIAVVNYNMGNIKSVENAFKKIGAEIKTTCNAEVVRNASAVVLPGVGAFRDAIGNLKSLNLVDIILETVLKGKPFLGICIGLQILFEYGMEGGRSKGLGVLKGRVEKIPQGVKIPHMGWNRVKILKKNSRIFEGIRDDESFYFVHSYHVICPDKAMIGSTTDYGIEIVSSVESQNLFAVQFHPEKSSTSGLKMLKNFTDIAFRGTGGV